VGYVRLSAACSFGSVLPKFKYKRLLGLVFSILIDSSWQMLRLGQSRWRMVGDGGGGAEGERRGNNGVPGFLVRRGFKVRERGSISPFPG